MKLKFVLYYTVLLCMVTSLSRAGTWDTLYTRQTGISYPTVDFTPDDSLVVVTNQVYRTVDGEYLGKFNAMLCKFTRDGKYALVMKNNKTPALLDWKNGWRTIVECDSAEDKILLYKNVYISDDNKIIVGASWQSVTIWDAETGKIRKTLQVRQDTTLSGSGQNAVILSYDIKSIALLADGKSLCISENVVVYSNSAQKILSEYYLGEVIDIETGERKAIAKDILSFIAIPGSNDVIGAGKRDSSKSYFDAFYLYNGYTLSKRFIYNIPWDDEALISISFNNIKNTFFYRSYSFTGVIETSTGKILKFINEGIGFPAVLSSNNKYVAVSGLAMYEFDKLFNISNVIIPDKNTTQILPQPSSGILRITNSELLNELPISIKVFDVKGSELPTMLSIISQQEGSLTLDVSSLPNSQYTLTLQQVDKVFSYSFILTK